MAKLLFDPVSYQFYYRCRSEETAPAIAAGFGWDPIRHRYCTDDPTVAMSLAEYGDTYVMHLLADVVETIGMPSFGATKARTRPCGTEMIDVAPAQPIPQGPIHPTTLIR